MPLVCPSLGKIYCVHHRVADHNWLYGSQNGEFAPEFHGSERFLVHSGRNISFERNIIPPVKMGTFQNATEVYPFPCHTLLHASSMPSTYVNSKKGVGLDATCPCSRLLRFPKIFTNRPHGLHFTTYSIHSACYVLCVSCFKSTVCSRL